MREHLHSFLKWAGPALLALSLGGPLTLAASLDAYDATVTRYYDQLFELVKNPLVAAALVLVALAYGYAIVWTSDKAHRKRTARSGTTSIESLRALSREWIALSDELLMELEVHRNKDDPGLLGSVSKTARKREIQDLLARSGDFRARIERQYSRRVTAALRDIEAQGISPPKLAVGWSTNPLSIKEAAAEIGAAGMHLARRIEAEDAND